MRDDDFALLGGRVHPGIRLPACRMAKPTCFMSKPGRADVSIRILPSQRWPPVGRMFFLGMNRNARLLTADVSGGFYCKPAHTGIV